MTVFVVLVAFWMKDGNVALVSRPLPPNVSCEEGFQGAVAFAMSIHAKDNNPIVGIGFAGCQKIEGVPLHTASNETR